MRAGRPRGRCGGPAGSSCTGRPVATGRGPLRAMAASPAAPAARQKASAVQFVRKHLLDVPPYTPIEPFEVLSARYGRTPQQIVKLDANENPYGPPPEVRQALADMPWPHIYPDPETRQLRKALAELSGVPEDYLLVRAPPRLAAPPPAAPRRWGPPPLALVAPGRSRPRPRPVAAAAPPMGRRGPQPPAPRPPGRARRAHTNTLERLRPLPCAHAPCRAPTPPPPPPPPPRPRSAAARTS
jgi:hypothetical protein